jgi:hypothetical protein
VLPCLPVRTEIRDVFENRLYALATEEWNFVRRPGPNLPGTTRVAPVFDHDGTVVRVVTLRARTIKEWVYEFKATVETL